MSTLTPTDLTKAVRNEGYGTFTLTNPHTGEERTFERKHLTYDAYLEFIELAQPIVGEMINAFEPGNQNGELQIQFNPTALDYQKLIKLAGKELPRLALLCVQASDPKLKIDELKRLAPRPQAMLEIVLGQVAHNEMVKEFADFFQTIARQLTDLVPQVSAAVGPVGPETTTTTEA